MRDIIPPGCVIVPAGKLVVFHAIVFFSEQRQHLAVAIQQPFQAPGIHPDINIRSREMANEIHNNVLVIWCNERSGLA